MVLAALLGAAQTLTALLLWFCTTSGRPVRAFLLLSLLVALAAL